MKKKVYSKENFHTTHSDGRYDRTLGFLYEQFRRMSGARLPSLAGKPDCGPNSYPLRNRQAWWYVKAGMIALAVENPATGIKKIVFNSIVQGHYDEPLRAKIVSAKASTIFESHLHCTISAFTPILFLNPPSRLWAQTWRLLNIKIQETIER